MSAMRDPSKTSSYAAEIAEQAHPGGRLPRAEFALTDRDFFLVKTRTRSGHGFSKSREMQYMVGLEFKNRNEELKWPQLDNIISQHAQMIRPFRVVEKGCRELRNDTFTAPFKFHRSKEFGYPFDFAGHMVSFGMVLFWFSGDRADQSKEIGMSRWFLRKKRAGKNSPLFEGCSKTGWEFEIADRKDFKIDYESYWKLLRFELKFDNPALPHDDRSHHCHNGEIIVPVKDPLGTTSAMKIQQRS
jgi:hypothetical protein